MGFYTFNLHAQHQHRHTLKPHQGSEAEQHQDHRACWKYLKKWSFFSLSLSFLSFFAFFSLHHFSIIFREAYLACWHRAVYSNSVNRMDHGMEMSQDFVMNQILSRESGLVCCRQWTQWLQEEKSCSRLRHLYAAQKDWILFLSFSQTTKLAT